MGELNAIEEGLCVFKEDFVAGYWNGWFDVLVWLEVLDLAAGKTSNVFFV